MKSNNILMLDGCVLQRLYEKYSNIHYAGKKSFLPRIKYKAKESAGLPFVLLRK